MLVPLRAPGVTVRPIAQLDGETGFAEVFFDDARVPVANRLGGEGEGWKVAMATAGFERGLMLRSPARFQETARQLVALYRENAGERGRRSPREAVVRCLVEAEAYALETYRTVSRLLAGGQHRRRGEPQQDLLVGARPAHARDGAPDPRRAGRAPARGARGAGASATGSTATCSRSPARSTPAPTRSSAT